MSDVRLFHPWWVLLAIPAVLLTLVLVYRRRKSAVVYSDVELLRALPTTLAMRAKKTLPWFRLLAILLMIVALARPQKGLSEFRDRTKGVAIQMCLDRSGSMQALDFELDGEAVDRLTAVKAVFRKFVEGGDGLRGRADDLIGLVAFGGFAESRAPLTLDHDALLEILSDVKVAQPQFDARGELIGGADFLKEELATAIGDAVAVAVERLKDSPAKSKVIILLSDGEQTAGAVKPEEAARAAKQFGVKIYSIGVGQTGRAPFREFDRAGRAVITARYVRLDEATLRMMAETSNGKYFHASDTQALADVYAEIDQLEKTETEGRIFVQYRELYQWFLIPGIAILLAVVVLNNTRFRSLP